MPPLNPWQLKHAMKLKNSRLINFIKVNILYINFKHYLKNKQNTSSFFLLLWLKWKLKQFSNTKYTLTLFLRVGLRRRNIYTKAKLNIGHELLLINLWPGTIDSTVPEKNRIPLSENLILLSYLINWEWEKWNKKLNNYLTGKLVPSFMNY